MSDETIEIDTRILDKIIKTLKDDNAKARVGILGDKNSRKDANSNASIGAKHEYGKDGMPQRSFLRVPITEHMQKYLDQSGAFDKEALREVVTAGSLVSWLKKIGIIGEQIVAEAFATGGFGKWKPSNMKYKKVQMTLVETQQLRNSITSEVK